MSPKDIKILHAAIPFLHPNIRPLLTIFCNIAECNQCMQSARTRSSDIPAGEALISDSDKLFQAISPLLSPQEQSMMNQFHSMQDALRMFSMYQDFAKHAEENGEGSKPMDFFMQMLSPEQQETMELMKGIMEENS